MQAWRTFLALDVACDGTSYDTRHETLARSLTPRTRSRRGRRVCVHDRCAKALSGFRTTVVVECPSGSRPATRTVMKISKVNDRQFKPSTPSPFKRANGAHESTTTGSIRRTQPAFLGPAQYSACRHRR